MKKSLLFLFAMLMFSISCTKENLTVNLDIAQQENFEIPASSLLDVLTVVMPVTTNWEQQFKNYNTSKDQLKELKLKTLSLNVTAPSGKTLRFLKDIEIYIVADGLVEKKIAFKENISDNIGQTLELDVVNTDLTPYAKKNEFKLRVRSTQDEVNPDRVSVRADMIFAAVAYLIQ